MTTEAVPRPLVVPGAHDRLFYGGMSIAMAVTVFVGFARTYYLGAYGTQHTISGQPFRPITHLHATLFTAWVLLFVVQTSLVAARRIRVHRTLGYAGAALAAAMIVVGPLAAIRSARGGSAPPGSDPLSFLAIPLGDITMFAIFVVPAILRRRDKETHKRLMIMASAMLMTAPLARWPGVLGSGPFAFYGLTMLFVVAGILYDLATRRRVHPVYVWGGVLALLAVPLRLFAIGSPAFHRAMQLLVGG